VKFTLIDKDNPATPINATKLTIKAKNIQNNVNDAITLTRNFSGSLTTGDLVITPSGSTNEIYASISRKWAITRLTLIASYGGYDYMYGKDEPQFANGKYHAITVRMLKYPIDLASVTPNYVGSVIGSDGKVYFDVESAVAAGTKASAIIAYVGSDTGDETYKKGLAIAMDDANGGGNWNKIGNSPNDNPYSYDVIADALAAKESGRTLSSSRHNADWPSFNTAYINNLPSNDNYGDRPLSCTSEWFLPSIFQLNQIIRGLTGKTDDFIYNSVNEDYKNTVLNKIITNAGGAGLSNSSSENQCYYASSSEKNANDCWVYNTYKGCAYSQSKGSAWPKVRAVLAF
jgi:hypothetical protein